MNTACGCVWRPRIEDRELGDRPFAACIHHQQLYCKVDAMKALLRRIHDWDQLDVAADGPFWRKEIKFLLEDR